MSSLQHPGIPIKPVVPENVHKIRKVKAMQKTTAKILLLLMIFGSSAFCQQRFQKVVYLSDGTIVKGDIVEEQSPDSLQLRNATGEIVVIPKNEILKIKSEEYKLVNGERVTLYKKPGIAFLLSFLHPGFGQYYNGEIKKGLLQHTLFYGGIIVAITAGIDRHTDSWLPFNELFLIGLGFSGGVSWWSVVDAPLSANRINLERHNRDVEQNKIQSRIRAIQLGMRFDRKAVSIGLRICL